jgi:hypothetical protein
MIFKKMLTLLGKNMPKTTTGHKKKTVHRSYITTGAPNIDAPVLPKYHRRSQKSAHRG